MASIMPTINAAPPASATPSSMFPAAKRRNKSIATKNAIAQKTILSLHGSNFGLSLTHQFVPEYRDVFIGLKAEPDLATTDIDDFDENFLFRSVLHLDLQPHAFAQLPA